MSDDWRNELATEQQMEKLRFFSCTWDEGITAGQASDALEECAKQFPEAEATFQRSQPATEMQKEKLRFFGCTWNGDITVGKADDALAECAREFPGRELAWRENEGVWPESLPIPRRAATTKTAMVETPLQYLERTGRANDPAWQRWAKAKQAPPPEVTIKKSETTASQHVGEEFSPTSEQIAELHSFGKEPPKGLTYAEAQKWIEQCKILNSTDKTSSQGTTIQKAETVVSEPTAKREALFSETANQTPLTYDEALAMTQEEWHNWIGLHGSYGTEPGHTLTYGEARELSEQAWIEWQVQHGRLSPQENVGPQYPFDKTLSQEVTIQKEKTDAPQPVVRREGFFCGENESVPHFGKIRPKQEPANEVTIQEAAKPQNPNPNEYTIPAREVQNFEQHSAKPNDKIRKAAGREPKRPKYLPYPREPRQHDTNSGLDFDYANWLAEVRTIEEANQRRHDAYCAAIKSWYAQHNWKMDWEPLPFPKTPLRQNASSQEVTIQEVAKPQIRKPATYKSAAPVAYFGNWVDGLLARNQTCLGGHWLLTGPLNYSLDISNIGLCRQLADAIESKGYCVEPDARFGGGKYETNQTLALFKPLVGDPIQPSTAYLGAANLLRLCILITTADGKIDPVELETFHAAVKNQAGLSQTDQKRLIVLEQLLAQELCSASKVVARITKSVSADQRLVVGKLLVDIAAANNFISNDERRVLERIFTAFEIPNDTLYGLIKQACPWPRREGANSDVSKNDKWLWKHWRTGHPGVVIDDDTLAKKTWNFTDWKALNARWRAFHEQLEPSSGRSEAKTTANREQSQKLISETRPKGFTLDMDRVYAITSETKEVIGILSVLMEDEAEKPISLPKNIAAPVQEVPIDSSVTKSVPQPTRYNGLDAAFHPILERLLTRDSWPQKDFKSLADEFHFMPLNIRDTLNEWSDETLGDFILDGENPVVIRRDLIVKGKTCYG